MNRAWGMWLEENIEKTGMSMDLVSLEANVSLGALNAWTSGQRLPKVLNLLSLCRMIADRQGRNPQEVVLESLALIPEYQEAQKKWNNKQKRQKRKGTK
jgi:hypothetical protein